MAYNAVAQNELSDSDSDVSRSPSPTRGHVFQSLQEADHLGASQLEPTSTSDNLDLGTLSSMIRSMTAASYDVVEEDDYDADHSPEDHRRIPPLNTAVTQHASPDPPLRSASSDPPIPLNHPTPDLQTIQGAYAGNVERLELSAERLSSSSADIGSEIRRLDLEQKRRSCSSTSNSIIMRNGAFSPSVIASPHGSTRSTRQRSVSGGSRLAKVAEPDHGEDGHFLDGFPATIPIAPVPQAPVYTHITAPFYGQYDGEGGAEELVRPSSAASNDTYQQARTLFTDFNGVHFAPLEHPDSRLQLSLTQPPLASNPESYKEPQTGENMVYYPAPVPRMLNLPPKLSRKPIGDREKRRTQLLSHIAAEDRKSAPGLAESGKEKATGGPRDKRQSTIPPQLRASVFFDPPSTTLEVKVKQDSAVATLESILDASANAPVSAFTDHPYAGHVGSYVYGNSKRKTLVKDPPKQESNRKSQYFMGQPQSSNREAEAEGFASSGDSHRRQDEQHRSHDEHDAESSESSESTETEGDEHSPQSDEEEEEEEGYVDYVGPPNTLLAELDLRKQELKQRTRPALPQPGPGMKGTLLEMDDMAQKQSEKRRRRPVTLAWDGHNAADDDDVPLAMLYPDKVNADDEYRPLGLMEKRQQEENEPLSTRRARLRGEPIPEKRPVTIYTTEAPEQPPQAESGDEVETLAERLRRLRGQNPADSDFASDLLAEFDSRVGTATKENEPAPDPENETLAQRRSRLQKENGAQSGNAKNPRMRKSMATLPQVRPRIPHKPSHGLLQRHSMMQLQGNRMSMQQFPPNFGYQAPMATPMTQPYNHGMVYPPVNPYNHMVGLNNGYALPDGSRPNMATRQPVEPVQRDMIDRWRQSIR
ncbi:uncharacterized protein N7459_009535 [Penicillium hispanicum]|uniref:uncharacterized protein n=1 Tax=Penicillium hispanicum TaxID=1080232 RepID=UPI0025406436|nr:uncharacterized protein N7459_009535 [Penicillium hispanicum]KAJ5570105.1 hypothetical protein N7459_009535 [Penicillium hispanicum]